MKKSLAFGILLSAFLVLGGLLLFSGQHTGLVTASSEIQAIKIGYVPVLVNLPLFVALEEGYFEKHGVKVEAIEAQSPNDIVAGMASGNLDGAGVLALPVLFAAEEKYPGEIKIFAEADETNDNYVSSIILRNDSKIEKPEDLKGKKIGVYSGLAQVQFLKGILIGMGLDPEKDVQIIEIATKLQLQGLESGQYEVLSTVEPYNTIAKSENVGKVFIANPRVKYIQNPFPSVAAALSSDFIKANPSAAREYLLAYKDAIDFIRKNPQKAKEYLARYTPVSKEIAAKTNLPKFNQFGEEDRVNIQKNADWMLENKLLKKKINVNSMFGSPDLLK